MPLIVLGHGVAPTASERPPGWPIAEGEALLRRLHQEITALVPSGEDTVVEGIGHTIHQERPDVVIAAIERVAAAIRDPDSWATPPAETVRWAVDRRE